MFGFPGPLVARNDISLYFLSFFNFSHFTPSPRDGMPRLFTWPKERDLARVKARRHVTHIYPFKYARIVLTEGFSCWDKRIGVRKCNTPLVAPVTRLKHAGKPLDACHRFPSYQADQFVCYQAHGLFRVPVERILQTSKHR